MDQIKLMYRKTYKEGFREKVMMEVYDKFEIGTGTTMSHLLTRVHDLHTGYKEVDLVLLDNSEIHDTELLLNFPKKISRCMRSGNLLSSYGVTRGSYILIIPKIKPEEAIVEECTQVVPRIIKLAETSSWKPDGSDLQFLKQCAEEKKMVQNDSWREAFKICFERTPQEVLKLGFIEVIVSGLDEMTLFQFVCVLEVLDPIIKKDCNKQGTDLETVYNQLVEIGVEKFAEASRAETPLSTEQIAIENFLTFYSQTHEGELNTGIAEKLRRSFLQETKGVSIDYVKAPDEKVKSLLWKEPMQQFHENKLKQMSCKMQFISMKLDLTNFDSEIYNAHKDHMDLLFHVHSHCPEEKSSPSIFESPVAHNQTKSPIEWELDSTHGTREVRFEDWISIDIYNEARHGVLGIGHKEHFIASTAFLPSLFLAIQQAEDLSTITITIPIRPEKWPQAPSFFASDRSNGHLSITVKFTQGDR